MKWRGSCTFCNYKDNRGFYPVELRHHLDIFDITTFIATESCHRSAFLLCPSNIFFTFVILISGLHTLSCFPVSIVKNRKKVLDHCGLFFGPDVRQWEYISYCLSQLAFTEKGMKKLMESFKSYEHILSEDSVMDNFRNIVNKVFNYFVLWHSLRLVICSFQCFDTLYYFMSSYVRQRSLPNQN